MGAIWIVLFIIIVFVGIYIGTFKKYELEGLSSFSLFMIVMFSLILLCEGFSLININRKFQRFIIDYNNTTALVESYNGGEYGNMPELTGKILDLNKVIAKHKAYCNNSWNGVWYSEVIGNLEPITFKKE